MGEEDWKLKLPEMMRQIENATANANDLSPLSSLRHHRLSSNVKDAAAIRTTLNNSSSTSAPTQNSWSPSSWTTRPVTQDVIYPSRPEVEDALHQIEGLPPIVSPSEICKLKASLKDAALGKAFLLQGGDCAELFSYCRPEVITAKVKLLLQMSLVLIWGLNKPVIRVARMAGQYAKPRSKPTELIDGKETTAFRGDIINGFQIHQRTPDPARLVQAYWHSSTTLNYLRQQLDAGIADLHAPLDWSLGHVKDTELQQNYTRIVASITESLRFMKTVGAENATALETVDIYTSHEGLVLEYEQSLTRHLKHPANHNVIHTAPDSAENAVEDSAADKGFYNTSAHFLWIGDRTRQLDGAHVEYFRGIENPIGIKVGPSMQVDDLVKLLDIVNPRREIGKVTLITRYGEANVEQMLGKHIDAVRKSGHIVVWQCDPMHGNTRATPTGIKTRHFSSILSEVASTLKIHKQHGSFLGGIHLELTAENVTECLGGSEGLVEDDLSLNYTTYCDPRLNEKQALELAFLIAGFHRS